MNASFNAIYVALRVQRPDAHSQEAGTAEQGGRSTPEPQGEERGHSGRRTGAGSSNFARGNASEPHLLTFSAMDWPVAIPELYGSAGEGLTTQQPCVARAKRFSSTRIAGSDIDQHRYAG